MYPRNSESHGILMAHISPAPDNSRRSQRWQDGAFQGINICSMIRHTTGWVLGPAGHLLRARTRPEVQREKGCHEYIISVGVSTMLVCRKDKKKYPKDRRSKKFRKVRYTPSPSSSSPVKSSTLLWNRIVSAPSRVDSVDWPYTWLFYPQEPFWELSAAISAAWIVYSG
jgi:hypothetical protein